MAGDYPDWTTLIHLIGADIMMPIDIQGAYIMMPVDIQAQYITLDIDITAQTVGNIEVDLVAATVGTLDIDIKAQTIGDITIDIEAQSIGVQLQPDWQTLQGNQKYFRATDADIAYGYYAGGEYEVPAGKTLYITHFGAGTHANTAANADLPQIMFVMVYKQVDAVVTPFGELGGNGGAGMPLTTPAKIPAGETFKYRVYNYANHNVHSYVTAGGYEI